jgi:hypothetical protein
MDYGNLPLSQVPGITILRSASRTSRIPRQVTPSLVLLASRVILGSAIAAKSGLSLQGSARH